MANYEFNSFYIVDETLYDHFYELIRQNETLSQHLSIKEKNNPFYLDFLRDTWFLFYCQPQHLITDSWRSFYLLLRKSVLDIASTDKAFTSYYRLTTNNPEKSIYYATLLCECTSLYFKKALDNSAFKKHIQHITTYYYNGDSYEKNYVLNNGHEPLYTRSQVAIMKEMLKKNSDGHCEITQIFLHYAKRNLTQLAILSLNKDSVLSYIYK